jgi:hypothetical protein
LCLAKNNFLSLFFLSQELPPSIPSSQQQQQKQFTAGKGKGGTPPLSDLPSQFGPRGNKGTVAL